MIMSGVDPDHCLDTGTCKKIFIIALKSNTRGLGLGGSILFCTFIALNLCQADSKAQHQNPN